MKLGGISCFIFVSNSLGRPIQRCLLSIPECFRATIGLIV